MITLIGPHPQSLSFYADLAGASLIFVLLCVLFVQLTQKGLSDAEYANTARAMLPLSVVFSGLAIALAIRMSDGRLR